MCASSSERRRHRTVLVTLIVADVAFAFQQSAIIPAIPTVQRDLGTTETWAAWLLTAYLMLATVATPALGRYADLHGRKRTLLAALLVFLVGSIGAALSPGIVALIAFRAVQGVGGAVFPLSFSVLRDELPPHRVSEAVGLLTGAFGIGTALGFGLGGLFAQVLTWRLIFACGAVLVGVGMGLVMAFVRRTGATAQGRFDTTGTVLLGTFAVGVLLACTLGAQLGWLSPVTLAVLLGSLASGARWYRVEARTRDPLIDPTMLRMRPILITSLATTGLGWALFGAYFLLPQLVQAVPEEVSYGFGADAAHTGLFLLPAALGQLVTGPLSGRLSVRFPASRLFAAGLVLTATSLALLATADRSTAQVLVGTLLLGAGVGLAMQTSSAVATQAVAAEQTSVSTTLNSTIRRFAGGVGGQASAAMLTATVAVSGGAPSHTAFVAAFATAAAISLLGGGLALQIPAQQG